MELDQITQQKTLRQAARNSIPEVLIGLSAYFSLNTVGHLILDPSLLGNWQSAIAGSAAASMFIWWLIVIARGRSVKDGHFVSAAIVGVVFLHSFLQLHISSDLTRTSEWTLAIVGAGLFLLSTRWLFGLLIFSGLVWVLRTWGVGSVIVWEYFAMEMGTAILIAGLVHVARKRAILRMTKIRMQMEEQLGLLEERNRFFEISLDMFCMASFDGYLKGVNTAFENTLGYSKKELMDRSFWLYVHPDDVEQTKQIINRLRVGESVMAFENRFRTKSGKYRWIMWNAIGIPDQDLMYATGHDITTTHETAFRLRKNYQELTELNAVISKITASLNLDVVLTEIVEAVGSLIPNTNDNTTIQLLDADTGILVTQVAFRQEKVFSQRSRWQQFMPGEGVVGWVIDHQKMVNIPDVREDDRYVGDIHNYLSLMVIPLVFGDQVFGTLSVEGVETNAFLPEDERMAQTFAQYAAIALENASLYNKAKTEIKERRRTEAALRKTNEDLNSLNQLASEITSNLHLDQILQIIVEKIPEFIQLSLAATVQLIDPDVNALVTRAATSGQPTSPTPLKFTKGRGAVGLALELENTVNIGDVRTDSRFILGKNQPHYRSLLVLPLIFRERTMGTLSITSEVPNAFSQEDERYGVLLARFVAIAVDNANLYETARKAEADLLRYSEQLELMVTERTEALQKAQERLLEQQRLEQEVALAQEVQANLLPKEVPILPGYEFAAQALAARYVSGDIYGFYTRDDALCHILLADIAGKGFPAALLTSTAQTLWRAEAIYDRSPGKILNILNTLLYDDLTQAEMFITLFAAQLNTRTGKLSYANAGHTQTLWWRKNLGQFTYLDATGMPIGVLSVADISESDVYILPGDLLIFYSDGLTDAENSYGEFFGLPRLEELIRKNIKQDAQKVVGDVFSALSAFSKDVAQSDDLTMIVLKIEEREVPFRFEADFAALDEFVQEAYEIVLGYGTPFAYQFQILVSELCTNIVKHAYQGVAGVVYGQIKLEENKVLIDIYDNGNPFDYEARKLPSPDTPQEGGYGLYVINEIADEITYSAQTPKGNHWKIKVNSPKLNDG